MAQGAAPKHGWAGSGWWLLWCETWKRGVVTAEKGKWAILADLLPGRDIGECDAERRDIWKTAWLLPISVRVSV